MAEESSGRAILESMVFVFRGSVGTREGVEAGLLRATAMRRHQESHLQAGNSCPNLCLTVIEYII